MWAEWIVNALGWLTFPPDAPRDRASPFAAKAR